MVTKKVINQLYKQYNKPPREADELNIAVLFDYAMENHGIFVDEDNLYIGSVDPSSPFATLPLRRINQIVELDRHLAIILPAAIVFLSKEDSDVNIHLRLEELRPTLWERVREFFTPSHHRLGQLC